MDRLWRFALLVVIVLAIVWWFKSFGRDIDLIIFASAAMALVVMVFAIMARNMGYVQAFGDHLRLVTPFLRLKIAYRRIQSARPMEFIKLFPPKKMKWADRNFSEPYFGKTVVAVNTNGYPLNPTLLRLFLPRQIFNPQGTGFVFVISDWMSLNTEIDSMMSVWRETQAKRTATGRGTLGLR
jgi:hypothetical protein